MGCCGSSRRKWRTMLTSSSAPRKSTGDGRPHRIEWPQGRRVHQQTGKARMAYLGTGSLVVVGPYTGRRYRFTNQGAVLEIDPRDAKRMAKIK